MSAWQAPLVLACVLAVLGLFALTLRPRRRNRRRRPRYRDTLPPPSDNCKRNGPEAGLFL